MLHQYTNTSIGSIIGLTDNYAKNKSRIDIKEGIVTILWNRSSRPIEYSIDKEPSTLAPNQILTLTYLQHIEFVGDTEDLYGLLFNREFYCILDHDEEVSCNGILFFGTQDVPIITLDKEEQKKFDILLQVFLDEFETTDKIQGEMLQMLLKRFIIKCVRLAKEQLISHHLSNQQIDTIRQYNYLVDYHYRTKRTVKDYANLLNKSPKTLSNLFSIYNQKSPQQIIHERLALEAKRLLHFTDKTIAEVAFDLGFEDPAYFSRFFKKHTQQSPSDYKTSLAN